MPSRRSSQQHNLVRIESKPFTDRRQELDTRANVFHRCGERVQRSEAIVESRHHKTPGRQIPVHTRQLRVVAAVPRASMDCQDDAGRVGGAGASTAIEIQCQLCGAGLLVDDCGSIDSGDSKVNQPGHRQRNILWPIRVSLFFVVGILCHVKNPSDPGWKPGREDEGAKHRGQEKGGADDGGKSTPAESGDQKAGAAGSQGNDDQPVSPFRRHDGRLPEFVDRSPKNSQQRHRRQPPTKCGSDYRESNRERKIHRFSIETKALWCENARRGSRRFTVCRVWIEVGSRPD